MSIMYRENAKVFDMHIAQIHALMTTLFQADQINRLSSIATDLKEAATALRRVVATLEDGEEHLVGEGDISLLFRKPN